MKKTAIVLGIFLLSVFSCKLNAQATFTVDNFSDEYFGKIHLDGEGFKEYSDFVSSSKGWIAIFDKKTNRQLIGVDAYGLHVSLHKGKALANIKELPYGEQSEIEYADYNFDGKKDFALMDGRDGCYGGSSFQIYLATDNGFEFSSEFSYLTKGNCYVSVDHANKQIHTGTKGSCCWHLDETYVVENNLPVLIKSVVSDSRNSSTMYVEKSFVNGKIAVTKISFDDEDDVFYSFEFSNKKKMRLLGKGGSLLYIFTDKDGTVELLTRDDAQFRYSKKENVLRFENGKTTYAITADGIIVTNSGKKFDMKAVPATRKGSLAHILENKFWNVSIE